MALVWCDVRDWSVVVCAVGFGVGGLGSVGPGVGVRVWRWWVVMGWRVFAVGGTVATAGG